MTDRTYQFIITLSPDLNNETIEGFLKREPEEITATKFGRWKANEPVVSNLVTRES